MKTALFLFAISLSSICCAQTNISELERSSAGVWMKKGTKEKFTGTFIEYFPGGKKMGTCELKDGVPHGQRLVYFENGNVSQDKTFKKGVYDGKNVEYYESGTVKQDGQMTAGKPDGVWKIYHENGNLQALLTYEDGEEKGDYFQYDENGKLVAQYYIVDGKETYSPEFIDAYNKALALQQEGNFKDAVSFYDAAIKSNPTVAKAYHNRGACKANLFGFEEAILDYDKALEFDAKYKEAYRNRGIAKINLLKKTITAGEKLTPGQTKSACEDFNAAAQLGDKSVENEDMLFLYCRKK